MVSTLNSLDGRIKANAAIIPGGHAERAVSVYVTQHDQRRARHQRLLHAQRRLNAAVLSADAVPGGRHPQPERRLWAGRF